ncbi:MAG: JmjC domain-containing protein [Gammaproteobacteria bacterium]
MQKHINPLGELSPEDFLKDYWQKKPLVIRQAFPNFESPISAEELAGLSCEQDVNSRIVMEHGADHPWQAIYGPMDDKVFAGMPDTHWTLLVNDVEKHLPELAWIVDAFRFIPEWYLDDLMISYAPEGGSVGPHMDLYDVFILQAQGHRRWQINTQSPAEDNQVAGTNLRIQKDFLVEQEWLMEAGDIIYIPPGVSHYGVATDDCLSFSIGFKASSHADLVNDFIGYITRELPPKLTFQYDNLSLQNNSAEITDSALSNVQEIFSHYLKPDNAELKRWFGRFSSDNRSDLQQPQEDEIFTIEQLAQYTQAGEQLIRHPASRFAFTRNESGAILFIDGEDYDVSLEFASALCQQRELDLNELLPICKADEQTLLIEFYNQGKLYLADEL